MDMSYIHIREKQQTHLSCLFLYQHGVLIISTNDVVIIIMTITIIVVVFHVKNVFLYIVIKKSCWTVTYSF